MGTIYSSNHVYVLNWRQHNNHANLNTVGLFVGTGYTQCIVLFCMGKLMIIMLRFILTVGPWLSVKNVTSSAPSATGRRSST